MTRHSGSGALRLGYVLSASACLLAFTGCGSLGSQNSLAAAQIRFVEVAPGSPEMDFYVNGTGAAYGVGFESFTSYLPVNAGAASLTVNRTGGGQAMAAAQGTLSGGHQYTAVVSHAAGTVQERVYADQDTPAPTGQIALRVLNEVEGAETLTVYVTPASAGPALNPVSVWSVGPGLASAYVTLPAGEGYTIAVTVPQGGLNVPVASVVVKAGSGAVRTIVFGGATSAKSHSSVVGFALADADPS